MMPWCGFTALICIFFASIAGLFVAPADYQQGDFARIMYVHVPCAWMALGIYTWCTLCSILFLISRVPMLAHISIIFAPIGFMFTLLSLITGSLWGKPTWGAWWVWDARLTTMVILAFLYLSYSRLAALSYTDKTLPSYLLVIGWINIPLIKWSVNWWYTLHQPASIMRLSAPTIAWQMLWPLLLMSVGFISYTAFVGLKRLGRFLSREAQ